MTGKFMDIFCMHEHGIACDSQAVRYHNIGLARSESTPVEMHMNIPSERVWPLRL